jgi:hypothetical protein
VTEKQAQSPFRRRVPTRTVGACLIAGVVALCTVALPGTANARQLTSIAVGPLGGASQWSTWGKAWETCQQATDGRTRSMRIRSYVPHQDQVIWNCYDTTNAT